MHFLIKRDRIAHVAIAQVQFLGEKMRLIKPAMFCGLSSYSDTLLGIVILSMRFKLMSRGCILTGAFPQKE
ncbi:hypothetical protein NIES4075_47100 [Tolypothrix sp. NIES-4075]|nr:hypothetical protein NIES4075_47100 [Tolypothrix sp. NIES-4075]